ncbi:putative protein kinase [Paratrimastix pyriformis]|uniref:Protein kinase domain-containing protein n=1 Tax=Paratrimastix pyriformis TaxID=342808 RepID=A0ABQ8U9H1_9EUKA|nr:putative protein kinase [Paratrimastix pyriformis]
MGPSGESTPRAAVSLRAARARLFDLRFSGNAGGALVMDGVEASLAECEFWLNYATRTSGWDRPMNVWLRGASRLVLGPSEAEGPFWIYADSSSVVEGLNATSQQLLPILQASFQGQKLAGGRVEFAVPVLDVKSTNPITFRGAHPIAREVRLLISVSKYPSPPPPQIQLHDVESLADFSPVCVFVPLANQSAATTVPMTITDLAKGLVSCAPPDPYGTGDFLVQVSNDGHQCGTVGTLHTFVSYQSLVTGALIAGAIIVATVLIGFGAYFLTRWLRLRRATSIELASWRGYQVASVDFSSLKICQRRLTFIPIGNGAAGEVFKGDLNGTTVAVKRLFETGQTEAQMADFKREVSLMRTLRHPVAWDLVFFTRDMCGSEARGDPSSPSSCLSFRQRFFMTLAVQSYIVALIGATFESPKLIITEFMSRGSLYALLHDDSAVLPAELRLRMAFDMARGLNYLHTLRPPILHRDVKSQNMLVTDDLRVKARDSPLLLIIAHSMIWRMGVSDFGISRLSQEAGITTAAGTPAWSAPEVLRGDRSWLPSDVYSFGVVLWELATRQTPWDGVPPLRVMMAVAQEGARLPIPPTEQCPPVLVELMQACFAERPEDRPTMQQPQSQRTANQAPVAPGDTALQPLLQDDEAVRGDVPT